MLVFSGVSVNMIARGKMFELDLSLGLIDDPDTRMEVNRPLLLPQWELFTLFRICIPPPCCLVRVSMGLSSLMTGKLIRVRTWEFRQPWLVVAASPVWEKTWMRGHLAPRCVFAAAGVCGFGDELYQDEGGCTE